MTSLMSKRVDQLTVAELLQILQEHAPSIPSQKVTKSGKVKKVKDPNAPKKEVSEGVKAWNAVVAEVLEDMKASGWTHPESGKPVTRKDAMAEASKRKSAEDPEHAAKAAARKQKRASDASEHKEAAEEASKEADKAEKPKKVLSPEHLAKMKAGREAKKAAKAEAEAPVPAPLPASPEASPAKKKVAKAAPAPAAKAAPAPAAKAPEPEAEEEWIRKTISGKKYLWNPANNHCYRCEADGSQGEWAGLYDPKKSKIDESAAEPVDFEE